MKRRQHPSSVEALVSCLQVSLARPLTAMRANTRWQESSDRGAISPLTGGKAPGKRLFTKVSDSIGGSADQLIPSHNAQIRKPPIAAPPAQVLRTPVVYGWWGLRSLRLPRFVRDQGSIVVRRVQLAAELVSSADHVRPISELD